MKQQTAIFTGTFDPFHIGHALQLQRAYGAVPYSKVVVGVIRNNVKKPDAASYTDRIELARITLASLELEFDWVIQPIESILPDGLMEFVRKYVDESAIRPLRIIGSDSLIEFADDPLLFDVLKYFEYIVTLRPQNNVQQVSDTIERIKQAGYPDFKPTVVPLGDTYAGMSDISARNLRMDLLASVQTNLIVPEALSYMREQKLYSFAA